MAKQARVYRTELSPVSFLTRNAYVFPDKTAVVHDQRRYTYRQFEERVNRLASGLRRGGLQKHDRVAFLCPNIPPMLEAHFGVPAAGGILVSINTRLGTDEIGYILKHSGSKSLFVDAELESLVKPLDLGGLKVVRVDDTGSPGDPYEDFLRTGSAASVESWFEDEDETLSINYTSGTTGQPKGVMYTHRGAYLNAVGEILESGMSWDTKYLWTLPMFHCNGWCFTWGVTAVAGTHICLRKVDPERIWDLFETEGITHYNGAPTVQTAIVNHPKAHRLARPVTVTVAAAPPSPTLLARLKELNLRPVHVYGLTETYGPHTVCGWHKEWDDLPLEEQAVLFDLVRVVDEKMNDVPRDAQTLGEVVMRGNNVMKGYFEQPDATAEAFRGGWFHSGDIGVWHPDGYIELRDRKKDIIISGGENISTIEVEQCIVRHPAVLECAVVAVPDERWGERPKAFVTLKPGLTATEQEIIEHCRQHIAHFKAPAAVEFGDLPKTSTGKVQKYILREREWKSKAKRIN
ncbi:MAG: acyl-CoA synthetase [Candidatus Rokubacteria bacterium 13_1_40CM_4_69_5]|nr:MAG: acyl-CoA synthetase [Candidatus Rokubacteria bacterium 13_1_40CM_4_69_5]